MAQLWHPTASSTFKETATTDTTQTLYGPDHTSHTDITRTRQDQSDPHLHHQKRNYTTQNQRSQPKCIKTPQPDKLTYCIDPYQQYTISKNNILWYLISICQAHKFTSKGLELANQTLGANDSLPIQIAGNQCLKPY